MSLADIRLALLTARDLRRPRAVQALGNDNVDAKSEHLGTVRRGLCPLPSFTVAAETVALRTRRTLLCD
jgi:hypothetical protein